MYALLCNKTLYIYIYINKSNAPQLLFACLGLVGTDTRNLAVKSSAEDVIRLHSPSIRLELPACRGKGCKKSLL